MHNFQGILSRKGNIAGTQNMATILHWKRLSLLVLLTQIVRGCMTYGVIPWILIISVLPKNLQGMPLN